MEFEALTLTLLALAAFAGGLIDAIAGGGGIITVPALLMSGMTPIQALATNKLQASFGSCTAFITYRSRGLVTLAEVWPGMCCTAVGAGCGCLIADLLSPNTLRLITVVMLCAIFAFLLCRRSYGQADSQQRLPRGAFYLLCGLGIGFYDGFFGPGTGTFWAMAFVGLLGFDLTRATGCTKAMNATSNIVSLIGFLILGHALILPGLIMGGCQIAGARCGALLMMKGGAPFIRRMLLIVTACTIAKLIWDELPAAA